MLTEILTGSSSYCPMEQRKSDNGERLEKHLDAETMSEQKNSKIKPVKFEIWTQDYFIFGSLY